LFWFLLIKHLFVIPNVKEALYMLVGAWNDVSKSTIVNCWNHANIIETKDTEEIINKINSENEKSTLIHDVREFLRQFERKTQCGQLDLEEFLQFDNNGETGI
jgi:predicted ABC-type ATPase